MSKKIINRIDKDLIIKTCKESKTFQEACDILNCGYRYLKQAALELGCYDILKGNSLKFSHKQFKSQNPWIIKTNNGIKIDSKKWCEEVFKGNIKPQSSDLRKHLFLSKYKEYKCENCGISEWNNKPISLQVHHIDGNSKNNKINNLRILCPNCHSQTDNYGSKNAHIKEITI